MASEEWQDSDFLERPPRGMHSVLAPPMPEEQRRPLEEKILKQAKWYRFFTLIPLLERLSPESQRVGGDGPAAKEAIRFRHHIDLTFNAGDVAAAGARKIPLDPTNPLTAHKDGFEITTTFLGLTGAVTPLPLYFAEEVAFESPDNPIRRDFLDIFHHRIISLLYRSVMRYALTREATSDGEDHWTKRALCIAGFDAFQQRPNRYLTSKAMLRLLPLLVGHARTAEGLELALGEALRDVLTEDALVEVRQFKGNRVQVDDRQRTQLGVVNSTLGRGLVMGSRTIDRAGRFAIRIGPLKQDNYGGFMNDGLQVKQIRETVDLFTRRKLDYDLELIMSEEAVPKFELSVKTGTPLGMRTWLRGTAKQSHHMHTVRDAMIDEETKTRTAQHKLPEALRTGHHVLPEHRTPQATRSHPRDPDSDTHA